MSALYIPRCGAGLFLLLQIFQLKPYSENNRRKDHEEQLLGPLLRFLNKQPDRPLTWHLTIKGRIMACIKRTSWRQCDFTYRRVFGISPIVHVCCTYTSKGTALIDLRVVGNFEAKKLVSRSDHRPVRCRDVQANGGMTTVKSLQQADMCAWTVRAYENTDGCPFFSWRIQKAGY